MSESALRSAGFQEKRDFPFSSLQPGVFLFLLFGLLPPSSFHCLLFILFSPLSCCCAPVFQFFVFPVGVVEAHSAHWLTFRQERGGVRQGKRGQGRTVRIAEEGEGAAGRTGCLQHSAVITFCFRDDLGSLKGHMGLQAVQ